MTEGALVLEGGALRCMFTSGVLDTLMEEGIELSYVNGVSAGSMCGMNYISKQVGRMLEINARFLHDKRYLSFRTMLKKRLVFNFEFVFGELNNDLLPFDQHTFFQSPQQFEAVATRCLTGKTEFFEKSSCCDIFSAVQASASMPMLSKMVKIDGKNYLDGGISLPIGYQRAIDLGYEKVVVVLTRQEGYQKDPVGILTEKAYDRYFRPLPELRQALREIPERYNRMQREIKKLEDSGRIFVIRPEFPVKVSRMEHNFKKLEELYREGRRISRKQLKSLKQYLYESVT